MVLAQEADPSFIARGIVSRLSVGRLGRVVVFGFLSHLALLATARADVLINFDNFSDSQVITNQIPGVTFVNTIALTAGISLNEFDFPPHSGSNVASDDGGPITISFDPTVLGGQVIGFSGYFTFIEPLTLEAFGETNNMLASAVSQFSNNTATGGDPGSAPNQFFTLSSGSAISSVTITGDPNGGSFVLDDITVEVQQTSTISPEPSSAALLSGALLFLGVFRLRRKKLLSFG